MTTRIKVPPYRTASIEECARSAKEAVKAHMVAEQVERAAFRYWQKADKVARGAHMQAVALFARAVLCRQHRAEKAYNADLRRSQTTNRKVRS